MAGEQRAEQRDSAQAARQERVGRDLGDVQDGDRDRGLGALVALVDGVARDEQALAPRRLEACAAAPSFSPTVGQLPTFSCSMYSCWSQLQTRSRAEWERPSRRCTSALIVS